MIKSIIGEFGIKWALYRFLYFLKLKLIKIFPFFEKVFEKGKVEAIRLDIYTPNILQIKDFLAKSPPEIKEDIINKANLAMEGKITAFSSIQLDYGNPIKWNYNPIIKKSAALDKKWYLIPDFDKERGDIKVIWEPSRFTHFYLYIRAYLITNEDVYYQSFSNQLNDWVESNEYSFGPNFKCGQEASLRMVNVLTAYSFFEELGLTSELDKKNVKYVIETSYKKAMSNFFYTHKSIKNNHTLSELMGIIVGSWVCKNDAKMKKAFVLLEKEIKEQFRKDGGYVQNSFNYQRFALQVLSFILKIEDKTELTLSNESREILVNSVLQMYHLMSEEGDLPNYGSNDGALIFPLSQVDYRDFRPTIKSLYYLLENLSLYEDGIYSEESIWFNTNYSNKLITLEPIKSKHYPESGIHLLKNDRIKIFHVSQDLKSRPFQMDQMHVDIWVDGNNLFCDTGTYSYATEEGQALIRNNAHNTVAVDNYDQMQYKPPFFIYQWPKLIYSKANDNVIESKMNFRNVYTHSRRIELQNNLIVINDVVESKKDYRVIFHTPYDVSINKGYVEIYDDSKKIATLKTDCEVKVGNAIGSKYYLKMDSLKKIEFLPNTRHFNVEVQIGDN